MGKFNFLKGFAFKDPQIEEKFQDKFKDQIWFNFSLSTLQILLILVFLMIMMIANHGIYNLASWWPLFLIIFILVCLLVLKILKKSLYFISVFYHIALIIGTVEFLLANNISNSITFFLGWFVSHLTDQIFSSMQNLILKSFLIILLNIYAFIRIGLFFDPFLIILLALVFCKIAYIFKSEHFKRKDFHEYFTQLRNLEYYKYILDKGIHTGAIVITLKAEALQRKNEFNKRIIKSERLLFEKPYINYPAQRLFNLNDDFEIFDLLKLINFSKDQTETINVAGENENLLNLIIYELERAEIMNKKEEIVYSNKSWGETIIKEIMSISITKDSNEINFDLMISKFFWNERASIILIFNDISDKVLNERLGILNKHKDHLLASVSHELKTPLNVIFGYTTELISRNFPPEIMEYLIQIKINSKLLQYQIDNILDYSQLTQGKLTMNHIKFNLTAMLSQIKSLVICNIQQKGLKFSLKVDSNCPKTMISDPHRLKQLLMIIIGNSIKFTFKGKIEIFIEKVDNNIIRFGITDTGIGIKEDRKKNLFSLFKQETNNHDQELNQHGIGLGLTLSKHLIDKLGPFQQIILKSEFGKGSEFCFLIHIDNKKKEKEKKKKDFSRMGTRKQSLYSTKFNHLELTPVIQGRFFEKTMTFTKNIFENCEERENECISKSLEIFCEEEMNEINDELPLKKEQAPRQTNIIINHKLIFQSSEPLSEVHESFNDENPNISFDQAINQGSDYSSLDSTPLLKKSSDLVIPNEKEDKIPYNFLIVDDTPLNLLILETFIFSENKENLVMKAYNGQQAIDIMRENPKLFDLILMDCNMPVLNGYEATKKLKELMRDGIIEECSILAISAYSKISEDSKWKECGMDAFIEKPLTKNRFKDIYKLWANKKRNSKK